MEIIDVATQKKAKPIIDMPAFQQNGTSFQILNGNWLEGYPLQEPKEKINGELQFDTTGEYLIIGKRKPKKTEQPTKEETGETFYKNAFLFWNCRDLIYSDSRMFLAPVPVRNGLAYIGENGFRHPTLGVYLEWWERCEQSHILTEKGVFHKTKEERLVWFISGSPLSGCNACASADKSGKTKTTPVDMFSTVWRSFAEINNRYNEIKHLYDAYSLEQVVEMLNHKESHIRYKVLSEWQQSQIAQLADERNYWKDKYYRQLTEPYREQLEPMLGRYQHLLSEAEIEPQKKKKELLLYWADTCLFDVLHKCYPDKITIRREAREFLPVVEKYIKPAPYDQQDTGSLVP